MVSFKLSPSELQVRENARKFAQTHLSKAKAIYSRYPDQKDRFRSMRPLYMEATKCGLIKAQVPQPIGGAGGGLLDAAILVEEFYAVEPAASLTIFGTGLGLTPLALCYQPKFKEFLEPFLSGEGAPLASLVFSEPSGVANYLQPGAPGLQTTARLEGDEWVLNGEKVWATNSAGWDFKGADLQCVVCRCINPGTPTENPADAVMILMVRREDIDNNPEGCFKTLEHKQTPGHTAASGPHIKYTNLRVPTKNVLCPPGTAAPIVAASFDASAALVGAMGVGLQRAIFDAALAFSKCDTRGGICPIIQHQAVADLLIDVKMRTETSRYLTWKAASCLHDEESGLTYDDRRELALEAKIYCSDAAVKSAIDAINAVGVSAYDTELPFSDLLSDAMVLPIFDGGNVGIRRRALQKLFSMPTYDAWSTSYGKDKLKN